MKNKTNHEINLNTKNPITWCPGCTNFFVKKSVQDAILELIKENKAKQEDFVLVADIGCGAKIYDYLNISGINSLHGRVLPTCLGIKLGNPNLKVLGFGGDGGTYNEGMGHLIHACRNNSDFTMFVHDNRIFALTAGQATATTEKGFKERTRPFGVKEKPINPILLALESGATFVARLNVFDINKNKEIIKKAIMHKGFSFIELLQPCIQFYNNSNYLKANSYYIESSSFEKAVMKAKEWRYEEKGKIPLGIFYQREDKSFAEKRPILEKLKKQKKGFVSIDKKRRLL